MSGAIAAAIECPDAPDRVGLLSCCPLFAAAFTIASSQPTRQLPAHPSRGSYTPLPNIADCDLYSKSSRNQAPRFRLDLGGHVPGEAIGVRAYLAGLGYHRLFIDGEQIGDTELDPGWSVVQKKVTAPPTVHGQLWLRRQLPRCSNH